MSHEVENQLSPWIENLILGHGSREEGGTRDWLKAYVTREGPVPQSQVQGFEGPKGLLLLTDGVLQIPAVLTTSAWEYVREHEDLESCCSLLHSTLNIQDYQLCFHLGVQPSASRFFLVVEALTIVAGGPVIQDMPCCSTLPSIKQKISKTCRSLRGPEVRDTQESQDALNLTDLLEQCQLLCVQEVLQDLMESLEEIGRCPLTPRASTSAANPPSRVSATGWDLDRVRYWRKKSLSVHVWYLLIPEEGAPPTSASAALDPLQPETTPPSGLNKDPDRDEAPPTPADPEDAVELVMDEHTGPSANPWDKFPPPCDSDSLTPTDPAHSPVTDTPGWDLVGVTTGTQLPVHCSKETQQASGHSYVPPYQKAPCWTRPPQSTGTATASGSSRAQHAPPTDGTNRKRKKRESVASDVASGEEAAVTQEPPSWLFDSRSGSEKGASGTPGQKEALTWREPPMVHSDRRPFSYSYRVSGQNLEDLSRLTVTEALLHWAVGYLVPPQPDL